MCNESRLPAALGLLDLLPLLCLDSRITRITLACALCNTLHDLATMIRSRALCSPTFKLALKRTHIGSAHSLGPVAKKIQLQISNISKQHIGARHRWHDTVTEVWFIATAARRRQRDRLLKARAFCLFLVNPSSSSVNNGPAQFEAGSQRFSVFDAPFRFKFTADEAWN